jgi:TRAP-type mannitol/chloroaromatic compound transport system permease large subunit
MAQVLGGTAVPSVAMPLIVMGADPIWLAVMMAMVLQTSFLTPPFGFALFYLRGVAPPEVKTMDIYRGVIPFIGLQLLAVALIWFIPSLATWLPNLLYR